jgi:predicted DNA-binding transcriptional regulator AlpA
MDTPPDTPPTASVTSGALLSEWMTRAELARELCVTEDTLGRWRRQRKGPSSVKAGRRVLYRRSSVLAWIDAQEYDPSLDIKRPLRTRGRR